MTLYEYNDLDELEQTEALWEYGVRIGERDDAVFRYLLYALDSFYIELKYDRELNVINGARSSSAVSKLETYFPNIDISDIRSYSRVLHSRPRKVLVCHF